MTGALFALGGRTAVVTGASRGIGKAIALRLAEHGAQVVVSSRDLDACRAVVAEIEGAGGEALAVACDIERREDLHDLVSAAESRFGAVDVLVGNAAINPYLGPAFDGPSEAFERTFATNVGSVFELCRLTVPAMAAAGRGSVILVSSVGGVQGSAALSAYTMTKAAEMQLARNLAIEWGNRGVRANCIAPGLIRTDFSRAIWEDENSPYKRALARLPLPRIGEADEVAGAAVFLAADASSYVTGQTIFVDGGKLSGIADGR
jgi:NAD(P)-dependent dehydrogenase (short-subunit alcohol dehydrogenase family)